jgi:hypothetical protein
MQTRSSGYQFVRASKRRPDRPRCFAVNLPAESYEHIPERLTEALQGWDACYGDLVNNLGEGNYRNQGLYIHTGKKVVELSTDITAYGTIPPIFEVGKRHPIFKTPIPFYYWRGEADPDYEEEEQDEDINRRICSHSEMYWNHYEFRDPLLQNINYEQAETWCQAYGMTLVIEFSFMKPEEFIDMIKLNRTYEYEIRSDKSTNQRMVVAFLGADFG